MSEPWITVFAVLLVTLGVLAEFNLMRVFLCDWREGRRDEQRRFGAAAPAYQRARGWQQESGIRRPALAASLAMAVSPAAVHAQGSIAVNPTAEASKVKPDAIADQVGEQPPNRPLTLPQFAYQRL